MTDVRTSEYREKDKANEGCGKNEIRCDFRKAGCKGVCAIVLVDSLCECLCGDQVNEKWNGNDTG